MKKTGRKSDSLGIPPALTADNVIAFPGPERAPAELTLEQAETWREMIASKPAGWFGKDSEALLVNYCIAVARRRSISVAIEYQLALKRQNPKRIAQLYEMERRQSATISSLSTKMRLSQQSRYTPQAAETANKAAPAHIAKPWEKGG
jgi:hypothetical protein